MMSYSMSAKLFFETLTSLHSNALRLDHLSMGPLRNAFESAKSSVPCKSRHGSSCPMPSVYFSSLAVPRTENFIHGSRPLEIFYDGKERVEFVF